VSATGSLFRLDRTNIKTTDPLDPTRLVLVGRQRTDGIELAVDGLVTSRWTLRAGYAGLDAAILRSNSVLSGVRIEGNRAGLVPRRSGNLWSTFNATSRLTVGAGVTASGDRFTSNDDLVRLPGFLRVDALASYRVGAYEFALNLQNLLHERYSESAGGNFQIYPGAPRHALVTARYTFR
jgi:catecholate siderophore receptor